MNTPIEDMERSMPVIMDRYEFREDSSGSGEFRGGCGLIRSFEITGDSTTVTIVSDRSRHPPWGLAHGQHGERVQVFLYEKRGKKGKELPVKVTQILGPNEVIEIRTAGGGGYGNPRKREEAPIDSDLKNGILSRKYLVLNYPKVHSRRNSRKQRN